MNRQIKVNMKFRDKEKKRYKELDPLLYDPVIQYGGIYKKRPRSFCLADSNIGANLHKDIRVPAIEYFLRRGIRWHDGLIDGLVPSNHLCCSQSCCVNFLYPMVNDPTLLMQVFQHYYPNMREPLSIEQDRQPKDASSPYLVFEWIGTKDYLNEQKRKKIKRTRGANYTSADFVFRFRQEDGSIHLVIGEWKYTEEYGSSDKGIVDIRIKNYIEAFNSINGVFLNKDEGLYRALFFEPFYQLMRLQLLAQEMEAKGELNANVVSILHVCPEANQEFRNRVTSPYLSNLFPDKGTIEIWEGLVPKDKFRSISVEDLRDTIIKRAASGYEDWTDYLNIRYGWLSSLH